MLNSIGHRFEQLFAGENISEKTEAQGDWTEGNGDELEETDGEENDDHEILDEAGALAFGTEDVQGKTPDAVGAQRPDEPEHHKNGGHGSGHVQIGIAAA